MVQSVVGELAARSCFTPYTIQSVACFSVHVSPTQHSCLPFRQYTYLLNSTTLGTHWNTENYLCLAISHFKTCLRVSCRIYSSLKRSSKQKCDEHVSLCAVNSNWRRNINLSSQLAQKIGHKQSTEFFVTKGLNKDVVSQELQGKLNKILTKQ
jgi:hypothetical protein